MMNAGTVLHEALTHWGTPRGFRRKTANWRRVNDDTIQVVNLQKSNYGPRYYLNFGIWLRPVDPREMSPQDFRCQLRARVGCLLPHRRQDIERLLDLESGISDADRKSAVVELMEMSMTDELIEATSSMERLRRPEQDQPAAVMRLGIDVTGRELLGRPLRTG